jgi:hypothetical protein
MSYLKMSEGIDIDVECATFERNDIKSNPPSYHATMSNSQLLPRRQPDQDAILPAPANPGQDYQQANEANEADVNPHPPLGSLWEQPYKLNNKAWQYWQISLFWLYIFAAFALFVYWARNKHSNTEMQEMPIFVSAYLWSTPTMIMNYFVAPQIAKGRHRVYRRLNWACSPESDGDKLFDKLVGSIFSSITAGVFALIAGK